jgi:uncharacterized membrane protein YqiK
LLFLILNLLFNLFHIHAAAVTATITNKRRRTRDTYKPSQYSGPEPSSNKLIIVAGVIAYVVIIVVIFESVVVVEARHRGVVLYVGAVENRVLGEGIHFIIPFAEQVVQMEVRTLKFEANATAASNDLQEVQSTMEGTSKPCPS